MIKSIVSSAIAVPFLFTTPAFAESGERVEEKAPTEEVQLSGFYVDLNNLTGWTGRDGYVGNTFEPHVGYEGSVGENFSWYIQGGPSVVSTDSGTTTEASGYLGGAYSVSERVEVYGEVYLTSIDDFDDTFTSVEVGATFRF